MKRIALYTGGGVSLSPVYVEGRTESRYVRLIADDGMMITNDVTVTTCADVLATDADKWRDCQPVEHDEEIPDSEALSIIMGGST